ncbi:THAP domain-containing protein 4-like [Pogonomyrmex barbatus]|uniref:THAP domain-containing protein 4-like n=1 Tax=Pogonomyrmex barbatus TaxID=144034 RepID=A0A6I9WCR7_9HYME|nr:THAP domain-containing protein 4-like [Pogonomyrmex barbatus]XP_011636804.1 THAP domain-containing protein 4-like [Pogonomyrmex barbatus]XP_011636806.1 THAP domain-containing protein 4-like [Pogonomyrmex barbatus]
MERFPLHEALEQLAWLEGTWRTEDQGCGKYPTIKDFSYYEEISFTSLGQPMFNYTGRSFSRSDLKKPMHQETGFLKVNPGTNQVSLILAHNFGLTTIECGEVIDKTINLNSTDIVRLKGTKMPHVTQIRREYKLCDNCLEYVFYMATSNTPVLTEHLRAKYVKVKEET